jgi:uncharacterized damage-inducible protein DinB
MTIRNTKILTRYNAWVNQLIFEAVTKLTLEVTTDEQRIIIQKIIRVLNHVGIVDHIWQAHLEGREHGFTERNPKDYPPLDKLWQKQQIIDNWYINWSDHATAESLQQEVNFKLISGTRGCMTKQEILLHVVNHTTYHRGMIANLFTQIGSKAPATDLNVFLQHHMSELLEV